MRETDHLRDLHENVVTSFDHGVADHDATDERAFARDRPAKEAIAHVIGQAFAVEGCEHVRLERDF